MSAYIVSKKIIDAIVTISEIGPKDRSAGWVRQTRWATYDGIKSSGELVTPDELGAALWVANVQSVNYRYSERNATAMKAAKAYTYKPVNNVPTLMEAFDVLSTYDYQSCEKPNYRRSAVSLFIERLRTVLIGRLPGYNEAYWQEQWQELE